MLPSGASLSRPARSLAGVAPLRTSRRRLYLVAGAWCGGARGRGNGTKRQRLAVNQHISTAHSRYRCQYHVVFAPKYRRKEIYGQLKKDIGEILRTLCKQKGVEIIEAEACVDHIHMLVSILPYLSVAQFMGFLKGKSSLMIFDRHANLKYKYGSRNFWCRGYYVDTVGRNKKIIAEYIRNQMEEDYAADQMSIKEYVNPFTGDKNRKA